MTFLACRSNWICASALVALIATTAAVAQQNALAVRPAGREQIASEPRQVVAATFTVTNTSRQAMEVESRVVLPARWQPVSPPLPFPLAAGESALKLISFTIPEDARGGDYSVSYEARDREHPGNGDSYGIQVRVAASTRLQVVMLELPDFAMAGEVIAGAAVLRNAGNVAVSVNFKVVGRSIASVTPEQGRLRLEPGETRRIELAIATGKLRERKAGRITFTATAEDASIETTASGAIQIAPQVSAFDALRTVDSRFESRFVARDAATGRSSGFQPSISGAGVLDEERDGLLRFQLRGPDRRESGSFGASEEYWVRYDSRHFAAGAGDLTYSLTPLLEPGRLGRGASLGFEAERWGTTAYAMRDTFGTRDADQFGFGSYVRATRDTRLGLNLLNRNGPQGGGNLWSLRAQSDRTENFNLDLELGQSVDRGARGGALRFALRDDRHALRYYALGWSADPQFLGPLRDKLYLSTGFDYPNPSGWGLRGDYRVQNWNLTPLEEIDPDWRARGAELDRMNSAPTDRRASLGTSHAIGRAASATLDVVFRERNGTASTLQPVDRDSLSWRAGLNHSWRNLSLVYSLEHGLAHDAHPEQRFETSAQMLSGALRVGRFQTYGMYWMRDDNSNLDERDPRRVSSGFTASYGGRGLSVNLNAQRSQSVFGRSDVYDLALVGQAEGGGRFSLSARRLEGRFARTDFMLSYSVPFALPVMRRADVTTLRGRVFDTETSAGLKNVILRLDGASVATNTRGEFAFPAVSRGAHQIVLEHGSMDVSQVPASAAPLSVNVAGRDAPPVMIAMVRSAAIGVLVSLHPEGGEPAHAAAGVLVGFRSAETTIRRLSDATGRVHLGGLAPGRWTVSVAQDTVPAGFRSAGGDMDVNLAPGESVSAEIPLTPARRAIRMLPPVAIR